MKKIVLNISEFTYEKLRFEAMHEKKSIQNIIQERILYKKFHQEVEEAFDKTMQLEMNKIMNEE